MPTSIDKPKSNPKWLDTFLANIARSGRKDLAIMTMAASLAKKPLPNRSPGTWQEKSEALGNLYQLGKDTTALMGQLVKEIVDERPADAFELLLKQHPHFTLRGLLLLEAVGRGHKHPGVFHIHDPVVASRIESLPYEEQQNLLENKKTIAVVVPGPDGSSLLKHKTLQEIKRDEIIRAVKGGAYVSETEQSREMEFSRSKRDLRFIYDEEHDSLEFVQTKWTIAELRGILSQFKDKSLSTLQKEMVERQIKK